MAEATALLPEGAYTTLRTYGGTGVLLLDRHLDRLEESARLLGHPAQLDRRAMRRLLCDLLQACRWERGTESRIRVTLDCREHPGDLWLSIEPLDVPPDRYYEEGAAAVTRLMYRENPRAKSSTFLRSSQEARAVIGGRLNEVLMVGSGGEVLEGLSSNFFAVRDGQLITAEEGVLPGLTRSIILQMAKQADIPIYLEAIRVNQIAALDEAFVSSTSRSVLPIVDIDGRRIGDGKPGRVTRLLAARYAAWIEQAVEEVCNRES